MERGLWWFELFLLLKLQIMLGLDRLIFLASPAWKVSCFLTDLCKISSFYRTPGSNIEQIYSFHRITLNGLWRIRVPCWDLGVVVGLASLLHPQVFWLAKKRKKKEKKCLGSYQLWKIILYWCRGTSFLQSVSSHFCRSGNRPASLWLNYHIHSSELMHIKVVLHSCLPLLHNQLHPIFSSILVRVHVVLLVAIYMRRHYFAYVLLCSSALLS